MIDQRDFDNVDILVDMYLKQHIPSGRYGQAQSQRQSPGQVLPIQWVHILCHEHEYDMT